MARSSVIFIMSNEFPPNVIGGLGSTTASLAKGLSATGWSTYVLTCDDRSTEVRFDRTSEGIHVMRIPSKLPFMRSGAVRASALFEAVFKKADWPIPTIIHVHSPAWVHAAHEFRAQSGAPVVYTSHSIMRKEKNMTRSAPATPQMQLQELLYRTADIVTCPSKMERRRLIALYPLIRTRTVVVPNGVDLEPTITRAEKSSNHGPPRIVFVGRLVPHKGAHTLIQAMPLVRKVFPGATLHIVGRGGGAYTRRLRLEVNRLRLTSHVRFHGWSDAERITSHYRNATVVALPSHYESFGLVALEAMAQGTPAIISPFVGVGEYLPNEVRHTVSAFTPRAWANALIRQIRAGQSEGKQQAVAQHIRKKLTWHHAVEKYERIFTGLIEENTRDTPYTTDWLPVEKILEKAQGEVWSVRRQSRVSEQIREGFFKTQLPEHKPHGGPMIANEIVAYELARKLSVPVARIELAQIEDRRGIVSIRTASDECVNWIALPSSIRHAPSEYFNKPKDFVRMFVFDAWICNTDRGTNENVIAHKNKEDNLYSMYVIDHNHTLLDSESKWDKHPLADPYWNNLDNYYRLPDGLEPYVTRHRDYAMRVIGEIESLTSENILAAIHAVPRDQMTPELRTRFLALLMRRRNHLREIIRRWYSKHLQA